MWLRTISSLALVVLTGSLSSSAAAYGAVWQDSDPISGEWNVLFKVQNTTTPALFKLKLDGHAVSGTAESAHTGEGTLREGSWRNRKLSFTIDFARHESIVVNGTLLNHKLIGEFRTEGFQSGWSATRKTSRLGPAEVAVQWAKLWSAKQLDQLIGLYAPDAVFLTGQGDRIAGREAIRALLKKALETINSNLTVHSIVTEQSGNLAYDSGDYRETITPVSGGAGREGKGNYVIVFRRTTNGQWLIIEHVWTDAPAAGKP